MSQLDDVFKWLEEKGLRPSVSRYSRYKNYIDDFYKCGNSNNLSDLDNKFVLLNKAVQECIQIVLVYEAFNNVNSHGLDERLKKIIAGSDFYEEESKNDQPRDFLYELLIAARFKKWGYSIDLNLTTDVVASRGGLTVYVECKRIKSSKKLEDNLRKACDQLSNVNDVSKHRGLVFVDIYNCISDKIKDYPYPNVLSMRDTVNNAVQESFIKPNANSIEKILKKNLDNTLGVCFTSMRCLWLENVTPQFYCDFHGRSAQDISDDDLVILNRLVQQN